MLHFKLQRILCEPCYTLNYKSYYVNQVTQLKTWLKQDMWNMFAQSVGDQRIETAESNGTKEGEELQERNLTEEGYKYLGGTSAKIMNKEMK